MSYKDLILYLLLFLEVDDSKTVFFIFAVNIHGMSGNDIFERLKGLKTAVKVSDAFIELLNLLLDKEENSIYVNDEEVSAAKSNVSTSAKKTLLMETPKTRHHLLAVYKPDELQKKPWLLTLHLHQKPLMLSSRRRKLTVKPLKSSN